MMASLLVCVAAVAAMIALTQPLEVREGRWWRIAVSLPLIWLTAVPFFVGTSFISGVALILSLAFLGFIWSGTLAHYVSGLLVKALQGDGSVSAGHIPDFQYARIKIKDGDLAEAVRLTLHELEKDPNNYEGLFLLAQLYFETRRPDDALKQIEMILQNPATTPEQWQRASTAKIECLNELNRLGLKPG